MKAWRFFDGHWHIFGRETNESASSPFMWIRECLMKGLEERGVVPIDVGVEDIAFLRKYYKDVYIEEAKK
jgi:hypothetical protein